MAEGNHQRAEADEQPHDVLAADEFAMPTRAPHPADPHSEEHEAHDVLAADEFAMPSRSGRPVDPHSDEREAHDVLAADEFAMPSGGARPAGPAPDTGPGLPSLRLVLAFAALAYLVMRRRRG